MKFDLHTHHKRCGHAKGNIRDYIEKAISKELNVIGISDHSPWFYRDDNYEPRYVMTIDEFPNYIKEVLQLKNEYKEKIEILLGVESDFIPEHLDLYSEIYNRYPFDYIIGSVHASNGRSIFNKDRWNGLNEKQLLLEKEMYYNLIEQSALSGLFDVLGHIDGMKRSFPDFNSLDTFAVEKCLKTIGECDLAIEVNTSTSNSGLGWQPTSEILEMALYYDVKVTFGSDAHQPNRVGFEWDEVRKHLLEIGYKEWCIFRQRKRILLPL